MKQTYNYLVNELNKRNIRLSYRRLKVLEYLCQNQNHPTADQIYINLQTKIPNLSRTTIYNTIHTLLEAGLMREINIEDNEKRYDIITKNHGHFKCVECSTIFDFDTDIDTIAFEELNNFKIIDKNLYVKGICPKCLLNINHNN